jgi:hypothetical protein
MAYQENQKPKITIKRKQHWVEQLQQDAPLPPAITTSPRLGSDVADSKDRASLRYEVFHVRVLALNMSMTEDWIPRPTARGMRQVHTIIFFLKQTWPCYEQSNKRPRHTVASSEYRDSEIWQRCGYNIFYVWGELHDAPSLWTCVVDVHNSTGFILSTCPNPNTHRQRSVITRQQKNNKT